MRAERLVTLGRVAGVFGIQGWIRVQSYTRPAANIGHYRRWWLAGKDGRQVDLLLAGFREHGNGVVAQLANADGRAIEDRDVAASWIGAEIRVRRADMPPPPEGQVYWVDLIGLQVHNVEGIHLGVVEDVSSNGAQDILVLRYAGVEGSQERLIPFVRGPIVKTVDLEQGLVVDWQPDY